MSINNAVAAIPSGPWHKYVSYVKKATVRHAKNDEEDILYWRDTLFTKFITYLLPLCFIALIPGVIMALVGGMAGVAMVDIFSIISIAAISLNARINLNLRKAFVMIILYLLSITLVIMLSLLGPGIVYLLALSVLITIIFPRYWGYCTVIVNSLICIFSALIIHFKWFNSPLIKDYDLGTWIAVSSNMLFLCLVIVIIISNTIRGLEKTIAKEVLAKQDLQKENAKRMEVNILLAESESHYKILFFLNPSPMWVLDNVNMQFLQVNESAIRQYGYTNEEFLAMNITDIKMAEDTQTLYEDVQRNRTMGTPLSIITRHRRKNKEQFYAEVIFDSILFKGKPSILAISQDITEQVTYVKAIEDQNEKFREIAWIQSHEVRGPLATILGLSLLFNDKEIGVSTEDIVAGILTSAEKLDTVIKKIVSKSSVVEFKAAQTKLPENKQAPQAGSVIESTCIIPEQNKK